MQPESCFLQQSDQPVHTICQQYHLCRCSSCRCIYDPGRSLTVGGLSVLLAYANQYMKPFNDISSVITELQNALACATRIFALLEENSGKCRSEGTY